eukprot:4635430-Karenia_brevis.AAC.1
MVRYCWQFSSAPVPPRVQAQCGDVDECAGPAVLEASDQFQQGDGGGRAVPPRDQLHLSHAEAHPAEASGS